MKFNTVGEYNEWLRKCQYCELPTCPAPQVDYRSLSVAACGASLPVHEDVDPADRCVKYRTVKRVEITEIRQDGGTPPGEDPEADPGTTNLFTSLRTNTSTSTSGFKTVSGARVCGEVFVKLVYDEQNTQQSGPTGALTTDTSETFHAESTNGSDCTGTYTTVDNLDPDNNDSGTIDGGCAPLAFLPGADWENDGLKFTKVTTVGSATHYTRTTREVTYSDPCTNAELEEEASIRADLPDGAGWTDTDESPGFVYPIVEGVTCETAAAMTLVEYRMVFQDGYPNQEVWWDEYFFPEEWDAWDALADAYEAAVEAKEEWDKCTAAGGTTCGLEPVVPDDPGEPPSAAPTMLGERSESGGPGEKSWHRLEPQATAGEVRLVNLRGKCYSSPLHDLPTAWGETYVTDEGEGGGA